MAGYARPSITLLQNIKYKTTAGKHQGCDRCVVNQASDLDGSSSKRRCSWRTFSAGQSRQENFSLSSPRSEPKDGLRAPCLRVRAFSFLRSENLCAADGITETPSDELDTRLTRYNTFNHHIVFPKLLTWNDNNLCSRLQDYSLREK